MIPKKIHYCWLSNDPFPLSIETCISSWRQILPDYEIVLWDLNKFPLERSVWVRQAYEHKKYAFAADYIRLYALYTEGGIYLDSDVEVVKSFNDLLYLPYFICKENSPQGIEAATIGAEKGCDWIGKVLNYYEGKSFVDNNGHFNTKVLPVIILEILQKYYNVQYIESISDFTIKDNTICVLPSDYFSPKNYVSKRIRKTLNTYSIHHFAGTWQPLWKKMLLLFWVPFKSGFPKLAYWLKSHS